jgi:GTPase SAR1 family protein
MDELKEKGPENLVVAIVGNKIDLLNEAVSTSEAQ